MQQRRLLKIIFLFLVTVCIASAIPAFAGDVSVQLQIPIPTETGPRSSITVCDASGICTGIAQYIAWIYRWLVGFAAVLAVLAMTWGGVRWLTSGGEESRVGEARKLISNAIAGLALALCSYLLLAAINIDLVRYKPLSVERISRIELKIKELVAIHSAARAAGKYSLSPGASASGFSHLTFDPRDAKKDIEEPGVLTQLLVDLLKDIDAQGFSSLKVSTLRRNHDVGSFHNYPGNVRDGRAADIVGTQSELSRLAAYLWSNQRRLQVNELYYAFNVDAAVEECVQQNSSYLNDPRRADLKKDHEDHLHVAVGCGGGSYPKTR